MVVAAFPIVMRDTFARTVHEARDQGCEKTMVIAVLQLGNQIDGKSMMLGCTSLGITLQLYAESCAEINQLLITIVLSDPVCKH